LEKELDLLQIWRVITKRWKMIVLLPLMAALVSALTSFYLITPQYEASTTMMVVRPTDNSQLVFQDVQLNRQLVGTYREITRSRRVLELVIAELSLPVDVEDLRDTVEVEAVRDTELIVVKVTDPDPELARDIANGIARVFMEQISVIMQVENVSVVDAAAIPLEPVSPRKLLNTVVAFAVGLFAAFGLAFLAEYLDRSIKDPQEAQAVLGTAVMGVIPRVPGERLFASSDPRSPASEAFRTMRTNIQYMGIDHQMRVLLVTGVNPSCGKSTVSANLAVTIAQTGARVLLIDADLRKPTQHEIFGIAAEPGLTGLMVNDSLAVEGVIVSSEHDNLDLLSSGHIPPYPAELLASEKMAALLERLAGQYDYLVIDSPPVIAVTDAAVLSKLVDGVLFVLDHGRVTREEASAAFEQLKNVQARIIGLVLNNVPFSNSYYNGYLSYYGSEESAKQKKKASA
jgi:polysaccharide biosynthesis transport protein